MRLVDYSLERFPDGMVEQFDWSEDAEPTRIVAELDLEAESAAQELNVTIADWIEQLALTGHGRHELFMPGHTYVGAHDVEMIDQVEAEKYEVGFFAAQPANVISVPLPAITLFSWRTTQQGFGILWSCLGFRCEPVSREVEEAIYQQVLLAAGADTRLE